MEQTFIPWASPTYWGNEEKYVLDALKSSWISGGQYVERLERDFGAFCSVEHVVSSSNGTTAIHMAYLALGIGPGDEVIVPGFGFMAAANVALHVGAKPVFCEVDPRSWCMTAADAERCITEKTKAIVPIHSYGNVCDMDDLVELARKHDLILMEDAAEAIGSRYRGVIAGTIAEAGVYSFHATKTITTGEGGAVTCRDTQLADRMRLFRSHGMSVKRYWHEVAGHNFRLANMQAAIGCAQLENMETIVRERHRVYAKYAEMLLPIEGISLQHYASDVDPVVWAIALQVDEGMFRSGRDGLIKTLLQQGIETRPGFFSADTMPHIYGHQVLPICRQLGQQVLSLPSSPVVTDEQIGFICDALANARS